MNKKILTLICAILVSMVSSVGFAAERLLPNLKKQEGLTTVYVGKALIRMAGDNINVVPDNMEIEDLIKYLDSIEVVNADTKSSVEYLRPKVDAVLNNLNTLDLAMEMNEDKQEITIYTSQGSSPDKISRLLIVVNEEGQLTLIDMQGDIPANILENIN